MAQMFKKDFFKREADVVARELLGCTLCVQPIGSKDVHRLIITETEAYLGPHDLACHSSKGRTKRTETLFHDAGTIYVYLIYGMYSMLNVVTGVKDYPAAVLIRGAGKYDGPGKLTKALKVTRDFDNLPLGKKSGIWIEGGEPIPESRVSMTPRIGVSYAGAWADKKLRFVLTK
ncbi:DNA-3-methyladenine glycosylase [Candidatus Parcubacteria bacterium]|uniref:Putative 3-methyladenine DNA glycosylase n=1 Tax=Candidatus Kaiserbacteria bacterium CG10_big_fil_rev_8_21_14_0_10_47_16 TaxID=1974608 RepID=A0A2H0UEL8_9BACT|nr:DNA-3-methyladenine glycosylase [Candidatus Parcubacteria bacterium]PIR84800.1 MAG: 3-methyladenine DNA glycosylase [Candidatus Kaiserbacteria bacterium CG10_big_fil_rev_8_21_14_0_10_47_16]